MTLVSWSKFISKKIQQCFAKRSWQCHKLGKREQHVLPWRQVWGHDSSFINSALIPCYMSYCSPSVIWHTVFCQAAERSRVVISSDLLWFLHVSSLTSRARSVASWVLSAFKARDKTTMLTLYKSLVRSHLEYCCPLWNTNRVADINLIAGVQRSFTSKIWGSQNFNYWERLSSLNLMSLQRRRERYIIIHMWKVLRVVVPNDLGLGIKFMSPSRLHLL